MKRVYFHRAGKGAQANYRAVLPAKFLCTPERMIVASESLSHLEFDAFMFPRLPKSYFIPVMAELQQAGKKLIWELDDDIWHIDPSNPAYPTYDLTALDICNHIRNTANAIVVSTDVLAEQVARPEKTYICPNLVDLSAWVDPIPFERRDGPLRILWAGSAHHSIDLNQLVDPVERLLDQHGDKISVYFFGDLPLQMCEFVRIKYSHLARIVPYSKYRGRVGMIDPVELPLFNQTLRDIAPDIALCPLADIEFNASKSGIKWMEYSLAGAATVATRSDPYSCITDEQTGLLVDPEDSDSWFYAIDRLIEDRELRQRLARNALLAVRAQHSWQHSPAKQQWINFLNEVV